MCTRFLFAVLPSELYWGDQTLRYMNTALADNLNKLFEEGVNATWFHIKDEFTTSPILASKFGNTSMHPICTQVGSHQVFFSVLGVKGDWPYLRKVGVTFNGVPRNPLLQTRTLHPCRLWPLTMDITAHASATFVVEKRLISS